jgi:ABC-2 type transport system ATP-binding protein
MNTLPPDEAITVSGLRKSFGRSRALDGLDLSVRAGEVQTRSGSTGRSPKRKCIL